MTLREERDLLADYFQLTFRPDDLATQWSDWVANGEITPEDAIARLQLDPGVRWALHTRIITQAWLDELCANLRESQQ